jgi:hypothetical protein
MDGRMIRSCPERYGYQPFSGPVNAARYITDLGETPAKPCADEPARGRRRPPGWCLDWHPSQVLDPPNRTPIRLEQGYQKLRYVLKERFHLFS